MPKPTHEPEVFAKLLETDFQKAFDSCSPGVQWEARMILLVRTVDKSTLTEEEKNHLIIACMSALRLQHKVDAAKEILSMIRDMKMEAVPAVSVVSGYGMAMEARLDDTGNRYLDAITPHKKELGL